MLVPTLVDDMSNTFSSLPSEDVPSPEALARAVRQRRADLRMSQEEVRRQSGLSVTTIGKIERGDTDLRVQRATLRRLDLGLRWPVGTCEAWYDGLGGVVAGAIGADVAALVAELTPLIAEQLRSDQQQSTISVDGLPSYIVKTIEQLVADIRNALFHGPRH